MVGKKYLIIPIKHMQTVAFYGAVCYNIHGIILWIFSRGTVWIKSIAE